MHTVQHICVAIMSLTVHQLCAKLPMNISFSVLLRLLVKLLLAADYINKCLKDGATHRVISQSDQVKTNPDNGTCQGTARHVKQ